MAQPSTATYQDPTSKAFKDFGFVHQKDVFVATLTAGEHLTFMATLRLGHLAADERNSRLERIARQMRLTGCLDTRISSLSGGEKRRLRFAAAVLNNPSKTKKFMYI